MSTKTESPWTPELIQRLRDDHAAGYSTAEIGRRLGVSKNAAVGKSRRLGLDQRENPVGRAIGQEKTEAAQELINRGTPAAEIAERVGIHPDTVRGMRKRMGVLGPGYKRQSRSAPRFVTGARGPAVVLFSETVSAPLPVPAVARPVLAVDTMRLDRRRTCEFLSGERRKMVACGAHVVTGSPYCPEHHRLCFVPIRRRAGVEEAA